MNTSKLGNIGEVKLLYELTKRGIPCYLPYGDGNTVDLIADFKGKLNRIQVKTCQSLNANGAMECKVTRQEGYHGNRIAYNVDDFDYFAFYCVDEDILCLVPFDESIPKTTITFQVSKNINRAYKTMRFVEDYSIDKIVY